jgi:phosphate butyryltransferase
MPSDSIQNRTFDELAVGDAASLTRTIGREDAAMLAALAHGLLSEDVSGTAAGSGQPTYPVGYAALSAMLVPVVLGTALPGPGTVYRAQSFRFTEPVHAGDTLTATLTVTEKRAADRTVVLDCVVINQERRTVLTGTAEVRAPLAHAAGIRATPDLILHDHRRYEALIARARSLPTLTAAVAHPCDDSSLEAALDAGRLGLIRPILVGKESTIRAVAAEQHLELDGVEVVDRPDSASAAHTAVELVRTGRAQVVMKGSLHTDELMHAVLARDTGLRTTRRISHVFILDVPTYHKPLFVTDAAVNIAPGIEEKVDILRNAIELAHALGIALPKVAVLSAVETVTPRIPSTLDAAALCKMADRGQITGAVIDGPLAMDNAISPAAARTKRIASPVAGDADILLCPDLEAGNILYKELTFLLRADVAGIVLGGRAPVILTSRADSVRSKMASCAVAVLYCHWQTRGEPT